ncbi:MAG: hypothetical protein AB8G86_01975, partial [Saprospiraceae bacterium]
ARQDFSIGHKMQFFLHTQFTTSINGGREGYYYLALLRQYALGNIKTLGHLSKNKKSSRQFNLAKNG